MRKFALETCRQYRRARSRNRTYRAMHCVAFSLVGAYFLLLGCPLVLFAQYDDRSKLVGEWSGKSVCVGNRRACHDEKVVYHIGRQPFEPDIVTIIMYKIVDGKPETMVVLDFKYDSRKGTLVSEFSRGKTHGRWQFTVSGNTISGTLTILPDKTIARRVQVKKEDTE